MTSTPVYEGTLEEILQRYGKLLSGQRVRVIPLSEALPAEKPFYETATPEEWARELRAWASNHASETPPLSEEAMSRESIYEGRGE